MLRLPAAVDQSAFFGVVLYPEVRVDLLLHLFHVRDDTHDAVLPTKRFQGIEHDVERLFIERAESLVEEEEVLMGLGDLLDIIGQCQRERQRGLEGLPPGEGFHASHLSSVQEIPYLKIVILRDL